MKKLLLMFASVLSIAALIGMSSCATPPPQESPAQIAAQICPPVQIAVNGLQADTALPPTILKALAAAAGPINIACASASTITSTDLQSLENLAFNVVLPAAQAYNPKLGADLLAIQIVLAAVNAAHIGGTAPPAPSTTPSATLAPATAESILSAPVVPIK